MKKTLIGMCVCVIVMAAIAIAADEVKTETPKAPAVGERQAPRGPIDRENVYKQMLARRTEIHNAEIAKIQAIVKIAEEEKATKTVEALKALIVEKDKEFQNQIRQAQQRRPDHPTPRMRTAPGASADGQQAQPETATPEKPEKKK